MHNESDHYICVLCRGSRWDNVDRTDCHHFWTIITHRAHNEYRTKILIYTVTHTDYILTYLASDMVTSNHSDASYFNEPKVGSIVGRHNFLSNNVDFPPNNSAVLNIHQIIKSIMQFTA